MFKFLRMKTDDTKESNVKLFLVEYIAEQYKHAQTRLPHCPNSQLETDETLARDCVVNEIPVRLKYLEQITWGRKGHMSESKVLVVWNQARRCHFSVRKAVKRLDECCCRHCGVGKHFSTSDNGLFFLDAYGA